MNTEADSAEGERSANERSIPLAAAGRGRRGAEGGEDEERGWERVCRKEEGKRGGQMTMSWCVPSCFFNQ